MITLPEKDCYIKIHNREQNRKLREILHDNGYTWGSGGSLTKDLCNYDQTHFHIFLNNKKVKLCSDISNAENKNHDIIDYTDIDDEFIRYYLNGFRLKE